MASVVVHVSRRLLWSLLLIHVGRSGALHALHGGRLLPRTAASRLSPVRVAMATGTEDGTGTGGGDIAPSSRGEVDLAAMTFEERLEYLAAQAPTEVAPKKEEEASLFGIDASNPATQWTDPEFLKLCVEDLKDLQYPSRKQTVQTVITSQIAFVLVIVLVLLLDAFVEAGVRSLLQGKPFEITIDAILKQGGGAQ